MKYNISFTKDKLNIRRIVLVKIASDGKKLMLFDDFTAEQRNLSFTVQGANQRASFVGRDHNLTFNTTQSKNCLKKTCCMSRQWMHFTGCT